MKNWFGLCLFVCSASVLVVATSVSSSAQDPQVRYGTKVPPEVDAMYEKGLEWLAKNQQPDGDWPNQLNPQQGAGVTGMCIMAFLSCGEDPNFGKYSENIRRSLRSIIRQQNAKTGFLHGQSMYHHGFGMLALAEAYGAVDESLVWSGQPKDDKQRTIGQALQLAVDCAVTSQKNNPWKAWRYSPDGNDADTSVAGAVLMGLLAARNAGVKVPDESIDQAIGYFQKMTTKRGEVGYSGVGGGGSPNLQAISILVYSISKRKDLSEYQAVHDAFVSSIENHHNHYIEYYRYYTAQALFQSDFEMWQKWNGKLIRELKDLQQPDGSFPGSMGQTYGTAMSLLALALNYRFLPIYER